MEINKIIFERKITFLHIPILPHCFILIISEILPSNFASLWRTVSLILLKNISKDEKKKPVCFGRKRFFCPKTLNLDEIRR